MAASQTPNKDPKTTGSQGVDPKAQKSMNVTHQDFSENKEFKTTKGEIEHAQQLREAVKTMNFGKIFASVDSKELSEWSFPDEKTGQVRTGTTPIIKAELPILGLIEIKDKDKNIFDKVEKGKSYIFEFRLENKIVNKVSYPTFVFVNAQHLPQFDKKISPQDLMGQDLSQLDF